ncbi:MAG: hypothetical protein J6V91_03575, partial [Kiritimatiellae bacterium]|nr:hypothetical protein [Kiritimatiellia bacterium]
MMFASWEKRFTIGIIAWVIALAVVCHLPLLPLVKYALFSVLVAGGIGVSLQRTWWRPRVPAKLPIFLMLHAVSDEVIDDSCANNTIRPSELERLIIDLKAAGYVFQTAT